MATLDMQHDTHAKRTPDCEGRLPDFLIIGAMKSGTTTLYRYLQAYEQVFMPVRKEPGFFSRDEVFAKGVAWYTDLFAPAGNDLIVGEASTCYSRWPHFGEVAQRIAEYLPDVKMIYLMRDPADRSYSHYIHDMALRHTDKKTILSLEQAIERDSSIIDASRYATQIERFLDCYTQEQMLLLTFDEMTQDPTGVTARVVEFLGVDQSSLTSVANSQHNAAGQAAGNRKLRRMVHQLRNQRALKPVLSCIPTSWRQWGRQAMTASVFSQWFESRHHRHLMKQVTPKSAAFRARVIEEITPEMHRLEGLLGRPVPEGWLNPSQSSREAKV